jgi:hypothetical protein
LGGAVGVAIVAWLVAAELPVLHQQPQAFTVQGRSGLACGESPAIFPSHDGDLRFAWSTTDGRPGTMSLSTEAVDGSNGVQLYVNASTGGSGDFVTWTGSYYTFQFCGSAPNQTASVSSVLEWRAPFL